MKKTQKRPRMQLAVSSEQNTQNNFMQVQDLATYATPSTASITTTPGQSSILDLSITIENTSTNESLEIKVIEIQLPIGSAANDLIEAPFVSEIIPSAEGILWDLNFGATSGEFLATPDTGDSNTLLPGQSAVFYLDNIKLNTTIGVATISIKTKDTSGIITDLSTTVTKEIAKAEITEFSGQPAEISPGTSSTLHWKTTQIDYCLISPGYDNPKHPLNANGSLNVQPYQDTTYTLWAYGKGVLLSSQIRISLKEPEILDFGRNGTGPVNYGENISLYWKTNTYTTSVVLEATTDIEIPSKLPTTTDTPISIGPLTKDTTFSLRAYDADKNESKLESLSVGVTEPLPLITEFSITWKDGNLIANWDTKNATQVTLKPYPSILNTDGKTQIYPNYPLQDSYTLIAKNDAGNAVSKTLKTNYNSLQEDLRSPIELFGICSSVATSPDAETIYVTSTAGENLLYVLDSKTLEMVPNSPVNVENDQNQVVVSKKEGRIFVTTGYNGLVVLDPKTLLQVKGSPVQVSDSFGLAISPDFKRVYVTNKTSGTVTILDYNTLLPIEGSPIKTGETPVSVAASNDNSRVFVTNYEDDTVSVFNTETLKPISESPIKVGTSPCAIVISPDGSNIYVANRDSDTLTILNSQTLKEIPESPLKVRKQPVSLAFSPDGLFLFIVSLEDNMVTVLNTQTLKPTKGSPIFTKSAAAVTISSNGTVYISEIIASVSAFVSDYEEVIE